MSAMKIVATRRMSSEESAVYDAMDNESTADCDYAKLLTFSKYAYNQANS